ncbi:hypothetical protein CH256_16720 [Rhodococcus sp. 05-2254-6]|nr:hypothetical protein CH256_16720 [Rhodococcus sp. 05-2254-6]OZE87851.1 hypothetical protein CH305_01465 [Rhodococcus sp. 15-649-2-2]OZE94100.1 hypothetical protein CH302_20465 [Rhodococcus sp. 15-2388-1-1a]
MHFRIRQSIHHRADCPDSFDSRRTATRILFGTDPRAEPSTTATQADSYPMPPNTAFATLHVVVDGT